MKKCGICGGDVIEDEDFIKCVKCHAKKPNVEIIDFDSFQEESPVDYNTILMEGYCEQ